MWFSYVAQFVGNHIVNSIYRCFDETTIVQKTTGRRHRSPALSDLSDDETLGAKCIWLRKELDTGLDPLFELYVGVIMIPRLHQVACNVGTIWSMCLHNDEAAEQFHALLNMRDNLQPVLPPQVQVRLPGDKAPLGRAWKELSEIPSLPRHPCRPLAELRFDGLNAHIQGGSDDHRCIRFDRNLQRLSSDVERPGTLCPAHRTASGDAHQSSREPRTTRRRPGTLGARGAPEDRIHAVDAIAIRP